MFEVLATSRRRSILGFRLPLGFCKGFSLKTNLSRKAKPFGVIPNGFALLFYCVSCFQAAFAMLKGSLKTGWSFVVGFGCGFNHAFHASGALTFLCFVKEK